MTYRNPKWMIYGANGFTGSLIAYEAKSRCLAPVLAGRGDSCRALGRTLGLETRIFSCESARDVAENLQGIDLVLHCAGPFSATSAPMVEACLKAKVHYLDITGEIAVFEAIHSQRAQFRERGVVAIPGVGFDVVPSDCLAMMLKEKMPDATRLSLGFKSSGKMSPGTAKSMIEGLSLGGAVRSDGKIQSVPSAYKVRNILFDKKSEPAVTIPWGDVSTAFYSTGIPNIEVYIGTSPSAVFFLKALPYLRKSLNIPLVQEGLKKLAQKLIKGPSEQERKKARSILWGEVSNFKNEILEMRLKVPEGYSLTADTAVIAVEKVLEGKVSPGAWTPSQAFGSRFILEIKGVEIL